MSTLEKVLEFRNQGLADPQIIDSLKQQGVSPKEINEALSQSQIKSEIYQNSPSTQTPALDSQMRPSIALPSQDVQILPPQMPTAQTPTTQQNLPQPSLNPPPQPISSGSVFPESSQEQANYPEYTGYDTQAPAQEYTEQALTQRDTEQEYYPEYQQYPEYQPQQAVDVETINDIAEQIVEEKTTNLKKQMSSI